MTRRSILLLLLAFAMASALLGQVQITSTSPLPVAYAGINYTYNFAATVQPPNFIIGWSQSPPPNNFPPGLNLTSSGTLSGMPTETGTFVFSVQAIAIQSSFPPATATFSLTIQAPTVVINTTSPLPNAFQGQSYSVSLSASSNPGGITWLVGNTKLPPGLNFSALGVLSGIPGAAGVYNVQLVAEITGTQITAAQTFSLTIYAGQISIQTTSLPLAVSGKTYAATLSASPPGVTWTESGVLPPGITFNTATGVFGASSTSVGIYPIQVTASLTNYVSASQNLTLYVTNGPLAIPQLSLPSAVQGSPYTTTVGGTGGIGPYQWSFVNASNIGLSIGSSTGTISGTPTTAGNILLPVMLTDATGTSITANLSLFVANPLSILSSTLTSGTIGVAYSQSLSAGGGATPYSWTLVAGGSGLPPGLALSPAGTVSGTPTGGGTYTFTAQVTDSGARTASKLLTLAINVTPLAVSTTALPNAQLSVSYSQALSATGGVLPYTWGLASGGLPQGLTLNPSTGVISGTPAGNIGVTSFTVQVSDSSLQPLTAQKTLSISTTAILSILTQSLPAGTRGVAYPSTQILASGGTTPYTWSITSGALPLGLALNSSSGAITGTPTAVGANTFTVMVTDATGLTASSRLSITINAQIAPLSITTTSLPAGTKGVAYPATQLAATGGTTPYTWSISSGSLPPGLSLTPSSGAIGGTPTATGASAFTVLVADAAGLTANAQFSITISAQIAPLSITTTSLPAGTKGIAYPTTQLAATGGTLPYTWSILSGGLPAGLNLTGSSGAISGTPTATGASNFTVLVNDAAGLRASAQFSITINAQIAPLSITPTSLPAGTKGVVYLATQLAATGGTLPYTWSISSGSLPAGLSLTPSSGLIGGTATATGVSAFTVTVTDAGGLTASAQFSITVTAQTTAVVISNSSLPNGQIGVPYSQTLTATGGVPPYTWALASGTLPQGLSLNSTTGVISGSPVGNIGIVTFAVQVSDSSPTPLTAQKAFTVSITQTLSITTQSLPAGTKGVAYPAAQLVAAGGTTPYTWSISAGALPAGLSLTPSSGAISGTPTGSGASAFTAMVTDAAGLTASAQLSITINAAAGTVSITTTTLPAGTKGVAYPATQLAATGGTTPYTWSISSGSLPAGLSLTPSSGAISGTPTATGASTFTVTVIDTKSLTASAQLSITINAPVAPVSITTTSLPAGTMGVAYPATQLAATGGTTPYTWSISSGSLPAGLSLTPSSGAIGGTPTATGTATFTVTVKDANGLTASAQLSITVNAPVAPVAVTTTGSFSATVGTAFSQALSATGGTPPYTWSASGLPTGLQVSGATITGTPTAAGSASVTLTVTDSQKATATATITINVSLPPAPSVSIGAISGAAATQATPSLALSSAYPVAVTGTLTASFQSAVGGNPTEVGFVSSGGGLSSTAAFTIGAGGTNAVFANAPALATGTVAGTITLTATLNAGGANITPNPAPTETIPVAPAPPVIETVTFSNTGGGLTVNVIGFSTTREMVSGQFQFNASSGPILSPVTVQLGSAFTTWYSSSASNQYGSQFTLTIPFTVAGNAADVVSVNVTLTNTKGNSGSLQSVSSH